MAARGDAPALWLDNDVVSSRFLAAQARDEAKRLASDIPHGSVVGLVGEFNLDGVVTLLALALLEAIVVPVSGDVSDAADERFRSSGAQYCVRVSSRRPFVESLAGEGDHAYFDTLRTTCSPGLVLFSSGSTGRSKGAVHDFGKILANMPERPLDGVLVSFLLFDHIGGINTLLRALRGGATLALPVDRSPEVVASTIERTGATILPTSPSFLALLLASGALDRHDLTSLRLVTYGTEVMPLALLERVAERLPWVTLKQTYGLSETGILSTRSESDRSTWMNIGGPGFQVRVVDGLLEVKSDSAMLGYLNAPSPYTPDGWFQTLDEVEVKGDLYRVLGRRSEVINVGGLKVFPQEVESALLRLPIVEDCVVFGRPHPLTGQTVAAEVSLRPMPTNSSESADARSAIRRGLVRALDGHKIPTHVTIVKSEALVSERFKKTRAARDV